MPTGTDRASPGWKNSSITHGAIGVSLEQYCQVCAKCVFECVFLFLQCNGLYHVDILSLPLSLTHTRTHALSLLPQSLIHTHANTQVVIEQCELSQIYIAAFLGHSDGGAARLPAGAQAAGAAGGRARLLTS